jgi:hypothetical protein
MFTGKNNICQSRKTTLLGPLCVPSFTHRAMSRISSPFTNSEAIVQSTRNQPSGPPRKLNPIREAMAVPDSQTMPTLWKVNTAFISRGNRIDSTSNASSGTATIKIIV